MWKSGEKRKWLISVIIVKMNGKQENIRSLPISNTVEERNLIASSLHDIILKDLTNSGFDILRSSFRGKSDESIRRCYLISSLTNHPDKVMWDEHGARFIFKTDDEIDEVINWAEAKYDPPKDYGGGYQPWMADYRKNRSEKRSPVMQSEYEAVHLRLVVVGRLVEVQLVKDEQEIINEGTRVEYELAINKLLESLL